MEFDTEDQVLFSSVFGLQALSFLLHQVIEKQSFSNLSRPFLFFLFQSFCPHVAIVTTKSNLDLKITQSPDPCTMFHIHEWDQKVQKSFPFPKLQITNFLIERHFHVHNIKIWDIRHFIGIHTSFNENYFLKRLEIIKHSSVCQIFLKVGFSHVNQGSQSPFQNYLHSLSSNLICC